MIILKIDDLIDDEERHRNLIFHRYSDSYTFISKLPFLQYNPKFSLQIHVSLSMEVDSIPNGSATETAMPNATAAAATITPAPSNFTGLAESLKLEHQFLRVPFEHYKKTIRANHRVAEKEVSAVISSVTEAADRDNMSTEEAVHHFNSLVSRLQGLKRKVVDSRFSPFFLFKFIFLNILLCNCFSEGQSSDGNLIFRMFLLLYS